MTREKPHDPYHVEPRKPLSDKQRLELFIAREGVCCVCGHKIDGVRDAWDEHIDPLWRTGTNDLSNRGVAHAKCARAKSSAETTQRAKVRNTAAKHFGAKRSKTKPMPFGRRSKLKKKMDGSIVER